MNVQLKLITLSIALILQSCCYEGHSLYEPLEYFNKNDTIPYRLLKPKNYNKETSYPLIIGLSGAGGRGKDNIKQLERCWIAGELALKENLNSHPCFVLVPQCPPHHNFGHALSLDQKAKLTDVNEPGVGSAIFEIVELLIDQYPIDIHRIYLYGQSMGSIGGWGLLVQNPNLFAAAILISGGANVCKVNSITHVRITWPR